ncbi:hypothetical protein SAMN04488021_10266 [Paracoccus aminovorans]|uniref:LicD family protein n=1 Tax=Paracoccus aminovorans TaxID=34004 RepID=A0A1I2XT23_9RHOB|nr:hypothetical protein [Paracoccus aminovorans]CQR87272.1 hypothetical protein JCM7685_2728 [Paracoccus aminovorans]SFH16247.1 hypothetical protein SAMN04488021_10266 [Paracoccus aminovorans]
MLKSLIRRILPRSYVTDRHGAVSRRVVSLCAFCATLAITMAPCLAREVSRRIRADDYHIGLARLAWYVRRRFPRMDMSLDPLYLFCSGMTLAELEAMRDFLLRYGGRIKAEVLLGELCFLSASATLQAFGTPDYALHMGRLSADADRLLDHALRHALPATDASPADLPQRDPGAVSSRAGFSPLGAEAALRDALDLLEGAGFRPFILSGTLLGAVREGRMLAHDYDIDLGLFAEEADLAQLERLLCHSPPFRCLRAESQTLILGGPEGAIRCDIPVLYKLRHAGGIVIDIFLHYRERDCIWHGTTLYRWVNSPFTLAPRDLAGVRPLAPATAEQNLTENYGDWRKPKLSFDCALDTPNLVLHAGPMALAVSVRRLAMLHSRPQDAARLLEQMAAAGFVRPDPLRGWRISETIFDGSGDAADEEAPVGPVRAGGTRDGT